MLLSLFLPGDYSAAAAASQLHKPHCELGSHGPTLELCAATSLHQVQRLISPPLAACLLRCSHGPTLEPFVATSLIQLLCRMTKLGWFEDDAYRGLADEARNFLEKGTAVSSVAFFPANFSCR